VFPNSAIFPVNKIAKTVIYGKSLKPPFFVVNVLSSKIKLLSLIFEEVVDRILECEKISIVGYIDTVQRVSTSGSGSLTVLICGTTCHEAMCDGTYIVPFNIYLT
jgi:hypothetical protein